MGSTLLSGQEALCWAGGAVTRSAWEQVSRRLRGAGLQWEGRPAAVLGTSCLSSGVARVLLSTCERRSPGRVLAVWNCGCRPWGPGRVGLAVSLLPCVPQQRLCGLREAWGVQLVQPGQTQFHLTFLGLSVLQGPRGCHDQPDGPDTAPGANSALAD